MRKKIPAVEEPLINITPLIDVVFVVLITFILIAPLLEMDQIELPRGKHTPTDLSLKNASNIQIHVFKDNTILLNQQKIEMKELSHSLEEIKKLFPTETPQLFHDKKAYFGTYQEVKNALEDVGFNELDIVLLPS